MMSSEMVKNETVRRLSGEPEFRLNASQTTDNRRERDYNRVLKLTFMLTVPDFKASDPGTHFKLVPPVERISALSLPAIHVAAHEHLPPHVSLVGSPKTNRHRDYGDDSLMRYDLAYMFDAPKPSQIVDEKQLIEWARAHLVPAVHAAVRIATQEVAEQERRKVAVQNAEYLASWASKQVMERARSIARYEQRLAALKAELEAELAVQAKKFRDEEELEAAVKASTLDFEPEGVDYAVKHFHERFEGWDSPFHTMARWSVEDVFPESSSEGDGN